MVANLEEVRTLGDIDSYLRGLTEDDEGWVSDFFSIIEDSVGPNTYGVDTLVNVAFLEDMERLFQSRIEIEEHEDFKDDDSPSVITKCEACLKFFRSLREQKGL